MDDVCKMIQGFEGFEKNFYECPKTSFHGIPWPLNPSHPDQLSTSALDVSQATKVGDCAGKVAI